MSLSFSELINKKILVGITYYDKNENVIEKSEYCGTITEANENQDITVKLMKSEKILKLPPYLDAFEKAEKGTYTLKSTGEVIDDPDYTCKFAIIKH